MTVCWAAVKAAVFSRLCTLQCNHEISIKNGFVILFKKKKNLGVSLAVRHNHKNIRYTCLKCIYLTCKFLILKGIIDLVLYILITF